MQPLPPLRISRLYTPTEERDGGKGDDRDCQLQVDAASRRVESQHTSTSAREQNMDSGGDDGDDGGAGGCSEDSSTITMSPQSDPYPAEVRRRQNKMLGESPLASVRELTLRALALPDPIPLPNFASIIARPLPTQHPPSVLSKSKPQRMCDMSSASDPMPTVPVVSAPSTMEDESAAGSAAAIPGQAAQSQTRAPRPLVGSRHSAVLPSPDASAVDRSTAQPREPTVATPPATVESELQQYESAATPPAVKSSVLSIAALVSAPPAAPSTEAEWTPKPPLPPTPLATSTVATYSEQKTVSGRSDPSTEVDRVPADQVVGKDSDASDHLSVPCPSIAARACTRPTTDAVAATSQGHAVAAKPRAVATAPSFLTDVIAAARSPSPTAVQDAQEKETASRDATVPGSSSLCSSSAQVRENMTTRSLLLSVASTANSKFTAAQTTHGKQQADSCPAAIADRVHMAGRANHQTSEPNGGSVLDARRHVAPVPSPSSFAEDIAPKSSAVTEQGQKLSAKNTLAQPAMALPRLRAVLTQCSSSGAELSSVPNTAAVVRHAQALSNELVKFLRATAPTVPPHQKQQASVPDLGCERTPDSAPGIAFAAAGRSDHAQWVGDQTQGVGENPQELASNQEQRVSNREQGGTNQAQSIAGQAARRINPATGFIANQTKAVSNQTPERTNHATGSTPNYRQNSEDQAKTPSNRGRAMANQGWGMANQAWGVPNHVLGPPVYPHGMVGNLQPLRFFPLTAASWVPFSPAAFYPLPPIIPSALAYHGSSYIPGVYPLPPQPQQYHQLASSRISLDVPDFQTERNRPHDRSRGTGINRGSFPPQKSPKGDLTPEMVEEASPRREERRENERVRERPQVAHKRKRDVACDSLGPIPDDFGAASRPQPECVPLACVVDGSHFATRKPTGTGFTCCLRRCNEQWGAEQLAKVRAGVPQRGTGEQKRRKLYVQTSFPEASAQPVIREGTRELQVCWAFYMALTGIPKHLISSAHAVANPSTEGEDEETGRDIYAWISELASNWETQPGSKDIYMSYPTKLVVYRLFREMFAGLHSNRAVPSYDYFIKVWRCKCSHIGLQSDVNNTIPSDKDAFGSCVQTTAAAAAATVAATRAEAATKTREVPKTKLTCKRYETGWMGDYASGKHGHTVTDEDGPTRADWQSMIALQLTAAETRAAAATEARKAAMTKLALKRHNKKVRRDEHHSFTFADPDGMIRIDSDPLTPVRCPSAASDDDGRKGGWTGAAVTASGGGAEGRLRPQRDVPQAQASVSGTPGRALQTHGQAPQTQGREAQALTVAHQTRAGELQVGVPRVAGEVEHTQRAGCDPRRGGMPETQIEVSQANGMPDAQASSIRALMQEERDPETLGGLPTTRGGSHPIRHRRVVEKRAELVATAENGPPQGSPAVVDKKPNKVKRLILSIGLGTDEDDSTRSQRDGVEGDDCEPGASTTSGNGDGQSAGVGAKTEAGRRKAEGKKQEENAVVSPTSEDTQVLVLASCDALLEKKGEDVTANRTLEHDSERTSGHEDGVAPPTAFGVRTSSLVTDRAVVVAASAADPTGKTGGSGEDSRRPAVTVGFDAPSGCFVVTSVVADPVLSSRRRVNAAPKA